MRILPGILLLALLTAAGPAPQVTRREELAKPFPGKFVDLTSALGVHFQYISSHTPKHYLPETMGAGVALFDYDTNDRLAIFLVNAPPPPHPPPTTTRPHKP